MSYEKQARMTSPRQVLKIFKLSADGVSMAKIHKELRSDPAYLCHHLTEHVVRAILHRSDVFAKTRYDILYEDVTDDLRAIVQSKFRTRTRKGTKNKPKPVTIEQKCNDAKPAIHELTVVLEKYLEYRYAFEAATLDGKYEPEWLDAWLKLTVEGAVHPSD